MIIASDKSVVFVSFCFDKKNTYKQIITFLLHFPSNSYLPNEFILDFVLT